MTPSELVLLPYPQHIDFTGGSVTLPETGRIALPESRGAELAFVAQRAQAALARHARLNWPIEGEGPAAALTFTWSDRFPSNEGYRLAVSAEGIGITARPCWAPSTPSPLWFSFCRHTAGHCPRW